MKSAPDSSPNDSESFAKQVRRAVIWRSGSQILTQIVQWGATFLVIRLLAPADYGLFAMTQVILCLLNMLNGYGLASGLVQAKSVTEREIRQLFGMLIVVNVALGAAQFALAPTVAAYYRQPMVADMLRLQSLSYLTTPFIALSYALLARQMDFREQARANIASSIAGAGVALIGAFGGWGVWTLVIAPMAMFVVRAIGMTVAARAYYWPSFDFRGAGTLARYGGLMAVSQLFWFLESQADVIIAGRQFNPHWLGIYTESLFLTQVFVSKFVPPLNEVAFSAYARLKDDEGAVGRAFVGSVRMIMVIALPFYIGFAVTAEPLVLTMMGPKWAEAVPIARLLALAMPFMTLQVLLSPACDAIGRPGISVRNGATGAAILTSAHLIGVQWGAQGLALAWIIGYPAYLATSLVRTLPVIGVPAAALLRALAPPLIAAIAMGLIVIAIDRTLPQFAPPIDLMILTATGGVAYVGGLMLFARPLIAELNRTVRGRPQPA